MENLRADWSKLLYYTMAGAGWFHIALGFKSAAQAFAKAKTTSKKVVKAATQALLDASEKDKDGLEADKKDKVGGPENA